MYRKMKMFSHVITDPMGLHARPCGALVKLAKTFSSKISVVFGEKTVDATRLMALMTTGAKCGDTVTVSISGDDEEAAYNTLQTFFIENI